MVECSDSQMYKEVQWKKHRMKINEKKEIIQFIYSKISLLTYFQICIQNLPLRISAFDKVWIYFKICRQYQQNIVNKQMSHLKAYCLYHSEQVITNFCKDKNCLMPLCPTCIREHTQYHQDLKTKPVYFSIYETVAEVKEQVYAAIAQIQQDNAKRGEILQRLNNWNGFVTQSIAKAKEMVLDWVHEEFTQMQNEIFKHFHQKHEELGVFSLSKTEKMEADLSKATAQLYDLYDSLKTEKFLGSIIVFLEETQARTQSLHSKFTSFQQTNDGYSPRLEINKGFKRQFTGLLSKMFRIQATQERENRHDERSKSPRFLARSKLGNPNEEKYQKLERSYTPEKSMAYLKNATEASRIGYNHGNIGYSNKIYKEESPQRVYSFSPTTGKSELHSLSTQPRRAAYRDVK